MSSVFLADLDGDWINPSQACTNPIFADPGKPASSMNAAEQEKDGGKVVLSMEIDPTAEIQPNLIRTEVAQDGKMKASVSLNDCLACSGCVTSAETVLITEQSTLKFVDALANTDYSKVVISLSTQSLASLADNFKIASPILAEKLSLFFHMLGAVLISDTSLASDLALLETASEFVTRFKQQQSHKWQSPETSIGYSSSRTQFIDRPEKPLVDISSPSVETYTALPMLASSCPGFICFAEKTQPCTLPYINTTKSPQQIMGTLVKTVLASELKLSPSSIFHATVMPCFDKKLEASRKDFFNEELEVKEVDLCLTTVEVLEMILSNADKLGLTAEDYLNSLQHHEAVSSEMSAADAPSSILPINSLLATTFRPRTEAQGAVSSFLGSGGFAEFTFRYAARELFGVILRDDEPLIWKEGRNSDLHEVKLEIDGKTVLCFALAYGFRNIQSVIQKMRRKSSPYHFVEIMACPGGCLNGGAQIKPKMESNSLRRERIGRVQTYFNDVGSLRNLEQSPILNQVYACLNAEPFNPEARRYLHTSYHAVPKMELINPEVIRW